MSRSSNDGALALTRVRRDLIRSPRVIRMPEEGGRIRFSTHLPQGDICRPADDD